MARLARRGGTRQCQATRQHAARCRRRRRHVRRIRREETPESLRPFAGVVHADARSARDAWAALGFGWALDPQALPSQVDTVQRAIDVHGAAEQPRAPGLVVDSFNWLERAQQHRLRHPFFARDHIDAVPESIDEIHVGVPRRTEHDGVARCLAAGRVRGEILGAQVRLGLDDSADAPQTPEPVHQVHTDELPRDIACCGQRTGSV